MSDKRRTFAVIDGNSLMHRAFHAVPPTMNAPDGRPTNAIFGFLNMFLKMIDAFNPDGVVVLSMHALWEVANKADIYEAYRGYKAFLERA